MSVCITKPISTDSVFIWQLQFVERMYIIVDEIMGSVIA